MSKTNLVTTQPLAADVTTRATMYDPALTYYADGTPVVMRARGVERYGVAAGRVGGGPNIYAFQVVAWADGTTDNVAPHVLHRATLSVVPSEALEANETEPPTVAAENAQLRAENAQLRDELRLSMDVRASSARALTEQIHELEDQAARAAAAHQAELDELRERIGDYDKGTGHLGQLARRDSAIRSRDMRIRILTAGLAEIRAAQTAGE